MPMPGAKTIVCVLAHQEERRIAACLGSLPLDDPAIAVHVVVNGSIDRTAAIASSVGGDRVTVHDWPQGGKARSWNRFVFDTPGIDGRAFVFVDGDAEVVPGSVEALAASLAADPGLNAVSGMPRNGRRAKDYQRGMLSEHGMFGDLYALSGDFVARMRRSGLRLPEDLVGDDGLLCALAKADLQSEREWREDRVHVCPNAGFLCEPASLFSPETMRLQYRRMINYSVRHFQNRILTSVMRGEGAGSLPGRLAELYPEWLDRLAPRAHPALWWFDRKALARMRAATGG